MNGLLKEIGAKNLLVMLTQVGGFVLAGYMVWSLMEKYPAALEKLDGTFRAHEEESKVREQKFVDALNQNTAAMRELIFWTSNGRGGKPPLSSASPSQQP